MFAPYWMELNFHEPGEEDGMSARVELAEPILRIFLETFSLGSSTRPPMQIVLNDGEPVDMVTLERDKSQKSGEGFTEKIVDWEDKTDVLSGGGMTNVGNDVLKMETEERVNTPSKLTLKRFCEGVERRFRLRGESITLPLTNTEDPGDMLKVIGELVMVLLIETEAPGERLNAILQLMQPRVMLTP
jgi:hypothetical protein